MNIRPLVLMPNLLHEGWSLASPSPCPAGPGSTQNASKEGEIQPCLLYTHPDLLYTQHCQVPAWSGKAGCSLFPGCPKGYSRHMLFPGLLIHSVYTGTEEGATQLSSCPAIRQPRSRACAEPSKMDSDHRVILSTLMCPQVYSKAPTLIYRIFTHTFPQEG